jgi:hypothetical protein
MRTKHNGLFIALKFGVAAMATAAAYKAYVALEEKAREKQDENEQDENEQNENKQADNEQQPMTLASQAAEGDILDGDHFRNSKEQLARARQEHSKKVR